MNIIENTMENCRIEMTEGGKSLAGENPERELPGRYNITITMCNNDDETV